jgi:hypothetical protein
MRKRSHAVLWVAAAGVGGWAAYEFLYKPWAASQAAAGGGALPPYGGTGTGGTTALPGTLLPPPTAMVSDPANIIGFTSLGPQYGGVLGACIAKKGGTWDATKCAQRLNDLVSAAKNAKAQIAALKANTVNPAAAGIPAAQAQLDLTKAALTQAEAAYNNALAAGDSAAASVAHAAMLAHTSDINDLNSRIAAAQMPVSNTAAIAAWEGALAGNDNDYFNLTGVHLLSAV